MIPCHEQFVINADIKSKRRGYSPKERRNCQLQTSKQNENILTEAHDWKLRIIYSVPIIQLILDLFVEIIVVFM